MIYLANAAIMLICIAAIAYILSNKAMRKLLDDEVRRRMKD